MYTPEIETSLPTIPFFRGYVKVRVCKKKLRSNEFSAGLLRPESSSASLKAISVTAKSPLTFNAVNEKREEKWNNTKKWA